MVFITSISNNYFAVNAGVHEYCVTFLADLSHFSTDMLNLAPTDVYKVCNDVYKVCKRRSLNKS